MNKRQIIASSNKVANTLDNSSHYKEATSITNVMKRLAKFDNWDDGYDDDDDDGARCPDCGSYDIDTDKNGHPTKCLDCDWDKTNE